MQERQRAEDRAIRATILGNAAMAGLGIAFALVTGSNAVLLDGVYSFIFLLVSLLTLYVAGMVRRPESDQYPFGLAPLEPLLNLAKGLIILAVSVFALFSAVNSLLAGGSAVESRLAVVYALAATAMCLVVSLYARHLAARSGSRLVAVDADSWMLDSLISGAVAVGFGIVLLLEQSRFATLVPYADPTLVVLLILGVLPLPVRIVRDAYRQVVGAVPAGSELQRIGEEVSAELASLPGHRHRLRSTRIGRLLYVQLYVVPPAAESDPVLQQQDALREALYERLQRRFPELALDVIFTADPVWSERAIGARTTRP